MARSGVDYFQLVIGAFDNDPKLSAFIEESGYSFFEAIGRWVRIHELIYELGWAAKLDKFTTSLFARKMRISVDELEEFVKLCVAFEIFDAGLWESERVLTSRGIQKRYLSARKRSKGIIEGPWSLLGESEEDCGKKREKAGDCPQTSAPYIREEKIREVKEREDEDKGSSSSSVDVEKSDDECVLMCMHPTRKGIAYTDNAGKVHRMAVGALQSSFVDAVPGGDFKLFARRVASLCPPGCRGHPDQVGVCLNVVLRALERFDPAKGSDPWVLTKKLLTEDRQVKDG